MANRNTYRSNMPWLQVYWTSYSAGWLPLAFWKSVLGVIECFRRQGYFGAGITPVPNRSPTRNAGDLKGFRKL